MKSALLVLATTLLLSSPSYSKTLVVSDIDDTIKLTDVLNSNTEIVINALFSKKAFSGMSALYLEFDKNKASIQYVSGSPTVIRNVISKFMGHNLFPQGQNLNLRANKVESYDHKIAAISRLVETENPDEIILIGDDGERDPEIYDVISKKYPRKVSGIYIRAIQNRALPQNGLMRNFFSAVEIAGVEHIKGTLSSSAVSSVVKSFIAQDKDSELAIKNRYCPVDGRIELDEIRHQVKEQNTIDELEKVQAKIIKTCKINRLARIDD